MEVAYLNGGHMTHIPWMEENILWTLEKWFWFTYTFFSIVVELEAEIDSK